MKLTYQIGIAALFGSFAVAAPANTLSLSFSIKEGDGAAGYYGKDVVNKEFTHIAGKSDICSKICYFEQPKCHEGWVSAPPFDGFPMQHTYSFLLQYSKHSGVSRGFLYWENHIS